MRISVENIKRLQRLYKATFGIDIDAEEAQVQGLAIMRLTAITIEQNGGKLEKGAGTRYTPAHEGDP